MDNRLLSLFTEEPPVHVSTQILHISISFATRMQEHDFSPICTTQALRVLGTVFTVNAD